MATWKRLTTPAGEKIDVNMERVIQMQQSKDQTTLFFPFAVKDAPYTISVKEAVESIHMQGLLRSM